MQKVEPIRKKTGGRQKGVPNKKTQALQAEVAASGITPLAYMLKVMRNSKASADRRDRMAVAAAPFVHAKLASIEVAGTGRDGALLVQLVGSDAAL